MKIFYDHQIFANQNFGGISRYFYELITHASAIQLDHYVSLLASNNVFAKDVKSNVYPFFSSLNFRGKRKILEYINRQNSIRDLKIKQFDLFHPTFYNDYFLKGQFKKPFVVTCHDMINEKFQEFFINDPTAKRKKKQIEAATAVVAVSENTKRDIIEILNVPHDKIFVTPLASSINLNANVPENPAIYNMGEYLLYVGIRSLYKNFRNYVESISSILQKTSIKLICAGGGGFDKTEKDFLKKLGIQHKVIQIPVDDLLLTQLYANAVAFIFPSKYEGFGIPTLEAFSSGVPVVLSNAGSLSEVGGNAAAYFDPYDQNSMYQITNNIIHDSDLRKKLSELGLSRAKEFSWEKTAKLTFDVYKSALRQV